MRRADGCETDTGVAAVFYSGACGSRTRVFVCVCILTHTQRYVF